MYEAQTYASAVGAFLKEYREKHRLTLDSIATAGREHGANWNLSSVRNLESGKGADRLPTMLILAAALGSLTGVPLTLSDLLGNAKHFDLPSVLGELHVRRAAIDRILGTEPVDLDIAEDYEGDELTLRDAHSAGLSRKEFVQGLSPILRFPRDWHPANYQHISGSPPSLAEERAAVQLEIHTIELRAWAQHLYKQSLEKEAATRAARRAEVTGKPITAQTRGAMTRAIIREIREAINADKARK